jgi:hypothetical protein
LTLRAVDKICQALHLELVSKPQTPRGRPRQEK